MIFREVDTTCQSFTCSYNMDGASVVDYLLGDPNSLHNFISIFYRGDK